MKLQALPRDQFSQVAPLFGAHMQHNLFCAGVITGKYDGQVIVDDVAQPRSAFVIKDGSWCYLGGVADNEAFNEAIGQAIVEKQFMGEEVGSVFISPASEAWEAMLPHLVADRVPVLMPRRLYIADSSFIKPETTLPEGFSLHFIDERLPDLVTGDLPHDVQNVLDLRAKGSTPDEEAFGYVVLHEGACVAHAMVDCIVDKKGDIGLVTEGPFHRRGLGTATSAATIAYGLTAGGLETVHWDCMVHNYPSVNLAEKLGLRATLDHTFHLIIFNLIFHLANLAMNHIGAEAYEEAFAVVNEQIFKVDPDTIHGHFIAGVAWAGLGDAEKAFSYLNTAVDNGWNYASELFRIPVLEALHGTPEWEALVARVQGEE